MKKLLTLLVGLLAFSSVSLAVSFSLPTDIQKKKDQLLPIVNLILNSNEYTEEQKNMVKTILSNCAANNKNEIIKNTCLVIVEELRPEEEKTDEITILQKRMDEISNDLKAL
ncbi:MAG: hypothetical protein LBG59_07010 [Candidatus Peribacteria bacterium]|jgi:hypothetical protein|nr:hypothetical protein [Candidatus Peribacteria bacterium]